MIINSTRAALAVISTAPGAAAWRLGSSLPMRLDDDALTPPLGAHWRLQTGYEYDRFDRGVRVLLVTAKKCGAVSQP